MIVHHEYLGWLLTVEEWFEVHMRHIHTRNARGFLTQVTKHVDGDGCIIGCPCGAKFVTNEETLSRAIERHNARMIG